MFRSRCFSVVICCVMLIAFNVSCRGGCREPEVGDVISPEDVTREDVTGYWWALVERYDLEDPTNIESSEYQLLALRKNPEQFPDVEWSATYNGDADATQSTGIFVDSTFSVDEGKITLVSRSGGQQEVLEIKEFIVGERLVLQSGSSAQTLTFHHIDRCIAPGDYQQQSTLPFLTHEEAPNGDDAARVAWDARGELHVAGGEHMVTDPEWCGLRPANGFPRATALIINDKNQGYAANWNRDAQMEIWSYDAANPQQEGAAEVVGQMERPFGIQDEMTAVLRPDGRPVFITTMGQRLFELMENGYWLEKRAIPLEGQVGQGLRATMHPDGRLMIMVAHNYHIETEPGSQIFQRFEEAPEPRLGRVSPDLRTLYAWNDAGDLYAVYSERPEPRFAGDNFEYSIHDRLILARFDGEMWQRQDLGIGNPFEFKIRDNKAYIVAMGLRHHGGLVVWTVVDLETGEFELHHTGNMSLVETDLSYVSMYQTDVLNYYPQADIGRHGEFATGNTRWLFPRDGVPSYIVPVVIEDRVALDEEENPALEDTSFVINGVECRESCEVTLERGRIYQPQVGNSLSYMAISSSTYQPVTNIEAIKQLDIDPMSLYANRAMPWTLVDRPWNMTIQVDRRNLYLRDLKQLHELEHDGIVLAATVNQAGEHIVAYRETISSCAGEGVFATRLARWSAAGELLHERCVVDYEVEQLDFFDGKLWLQAASKLQHDLHGVAGARKGWFVLDDATLEEQSFGWAVLQDETPLQWLYKGDKRVVLLSTAQERILRVFDERGMVLHEVDAAMVSHLTLHGLEEGWIACTKELDIRNNKVIYYSEDLEERLAVQVPYSTCAFSQHAVHLGGLPSEAIGRQVEVLGRIVESRWYARLDTSGKEVNFKLAHNFIGDVRAIDDERIFFIDSTYPTTKIAYWDGELVRRESWGVKNVGLRADGQMYATSPLFIHPRDDHSFYMAFSYYGGLTSSGGYFGNFGNDYLPATQWPTAWTANFVLQ